MNVIAQGTTPYLQIAVADDLSDAAVIYITIKQGIQIRIRKFLWTQSLLDMPACLNMPTVKMWLFLKHKPATPQLIQ